MLYRDGEMTPLPATSFDATEWYFIGSPDYQSIAATFTGRPVVTTPRVWGLRWLQRDRDAEEMFDILSRFNGIFDNEADRCAFHVPRRW